ncbi:hypothetical protein N8911_00555 [bacterium]|nr:hypothetical protein [bacterium]
MRITAHILSYLFHPIFLPTFGLVVIFGLNRYISATTPFDKQFFLVSWIFVNTAVIPFIFTAVLRWKKLVSSIQLETREDRIIPFTFALFFYLTNYWLLRDIPMPQIIYSIFLGSSVAVGIALLVNFYTKISIHMIGMGGVTASIYGMSQLYELDLVGYILLGLVASGLVGSARFILESHNLRQIFLGWGTGFISVYTPIILGWG